MPLWDDLQAPCAPNYTQHIDSNTATAQGVTAADSAVNVLLDLNLPDSIAWLDIEKYPRPTEAGGGADCSQAVQAYVNGFVYEMHSYGYSAGVYANGAYIWDDMNQDTLSNVPDAIWVPQYPGPGYAVQPLRVLDDGGYNLYVYEQRIHQVAENIPTGFSNGEPSQVDTDFIDGPVVAGPYNTASCNCDVCDPSCPNYDPNQCDDQGSWVYCAETGCECFSEDGTGDDCCCTECGCYEAVPGPTALNIKNTQKSGRGPVSGRSPVVASGREP